MNFTLFAFYLQWAMIGPASGGLQALTLRRKLRKGVGYSGTPWSGQAVNWNWRTSLRSLLPLWLGKTGWLFVHSACLFCMIEYYNMKPTYQVVKRCRHVCKFVWVRSPGYIYINNDSVFISASQTSRDTTFIQTEWSPVYWHRWIFHVHYSPDCAMDLLTWRFTTHQQKFSGARLDLEVTVGLVSAFESRPRETRSSGALRLALRRKKVLCLQQWSYLSGWHREPGLVWTHKSILRRVPTCVTYVMTVEKFMITPVDPVYLPTLTVNGGTQKPDEERQFVFSWQSVRLHAQLSASRLKARRSHLIGPLSQYTSTAGKWINWPKYVPLQ